MKPQTYRRFIVCLTLVLVGILLAASTVLADTVSVELNQPVAGQVFIPGDTLIISGTATGLNEITISVYNSATALIYTAQPAVSDGQFSSNFVLNGDALTGSYTIRIGGAGLGKTIEHSFQVQPSGSSSGDDNCFIATAAFGSKFQPSVVMLRQFRDQFLLSNDPGRAMVSFYYKNSPPIASYISGNENLKAVVRILLTPLVAVAYLLLHPHLLSLLLILLVTGLVLRKKDVIRILFQ